MAIVPNNSAMMQHTHRTGSDTYEAHIELCTSRVARHGTSNFLEAGAGRIAT